MPNEWEKIRVLKILSALKGKLLSGSQNNLIGEPCIDSRIIQPDNIFVAIKGDKYDGHDFIPQVIKKGVKNYIVQRGKNNHLEFNKDIVAIEVSDTMEALGNMASWWLSNHDIPVIAITGSVGKTTTIENMLISDINTLPIQHACFHKTEATVTH